MNNDHLYILWTSGEKITFDEMVYMYSLNAMKREWWKNITLIIWGASAELTGNNKEVQQKLKALHEAGVFLTACKACADNLKVSEVFERENIELKYWGTPLTELLQSDKKLITV